MTIGQAFSKFYNSFGIPAYPRTAVPDDAKMPYITYDVIESDWTDVPTSQTVQIWYKSDSEAAPSAKAKEIKNAIGYGGVRIPCDDGSIWLRKGSPWCINTNAEGDNSIKLRQLNVTLEYLLK